MSDTDEATLQSRSFRRKTLSLKKTETSTVKQSFSHGRTKAVVVEKKRVRGSRRRQAARSPRSRRSPASRGPCRRPKPATPTQAGRHRARRRGAAPALRGRKGSAALRPLADANFAEDEARRSAEAGRRAPRASKKNSFRRERVAAEKRKAEEEARKAADERAPEARRTGSRPPPRKEDAKPRQRRRRPRGSPDAQAPPHLDKEEEEVSAKKRQQAGPAKTPAPSKATPGERRRGKLTVTRALSDDDERMRSVASYKRHLQRVNKGHQQQPAGPGRSARHHRSGNHHGLRSRQPHGAPRRRRHQGADEERHDGDPNDVIDADTAELVAAEYGHVGQARRGIRRAGRPDAARRTMPTDLDVRARRSSPSWAMSIMARPRCWTRCARPTWSLGEAGGITQHIGAYQVTL